MYVMKNKFSILIAVAIAFSSCNNDRVKRIAGQTDPANDANYDDSLKQDTAPVDKKSNDFLVNAVNDGTAEAKLAKLAKEKAISRKVKDYAGMIVNDHGVLNDQLKAVSSGLNIALPPSPDEEMQTELQSLNKHKGKDFDKDFLDMMIRGHEKMIQLFEQASKDVNNAEVKTLIDNALPQLNKHLDSARALKKMYQQKDSALL
jgi:putative membrane protein